MSLKLYALNLIGVHWINVSGDMLIYPFKVQCCCFMYNAKTPSGALFSESLTFYNVRAGKEMCLGSAYKVYNDKTNLPFIELYQNHETLGLTGELHSALVGFSIV